VLGDPHPQPAEQLGFQRKHPLFGVQDLVHEIVQRRMSPEQALEMGAANAFRQAGRQNDRAAGLDDLHRRDHALVLADLAAASALGSS